MKVRSLPLNPTTLKQFAEYMVGGTLYFWLGYLVFAFCYTGLGWDWLPAKLMADLIGWTANYLVQRFWAFNDKHLQHHERATLGKYATLTIVNFGLDYALIGTLKWAGISPYIGFFISAGFFTAWNFLWYRFWVFYRNHRTENGKE